MVSKKQKIQQNKFGRAVKKCARLLKNKKRITRSMRSACIKKELNKGR